MRFALGLRPVGFTLVAERRVVRLYAERHRNEKYCNDRKDCALTPPIVLRVNAIWIATSLLRVHCEVNVIWRMSCG